MNICDLSVSCIDRVEVKITLGLVLPDGPRSIIRPRVSNQVVTADKGNTVLINIEQTGIFTVHYSRIVKHAAFFRADNGVV